MLATWTGKKEDFLNNYNNFNDLLNTFFVLLSIFDQLKMYTKHSRQDYFLLKIFNYIYDIYSE